MHEKFSQREFFKKLFFINEELLKYTLLNKHTILEITAIYIFIDSKKNIIIILIRGHSPYMPKVQPISI